MIYTVTLNPSVDYFVNLDKFVLGGLNRVTGDSKIPGGKGINVSLILGANGLDSIATGFIGGFTGRFIKDYLEEKGIRTSFVEVGGETRINVKLKAEEETEINGRGPSISDYEVETLKDKIRKIQDGDILVLAGSIPSHIPAAIYEELIGLCREKGAEVVVDVEGPLLKTLLHYQPFLIKPNHHELGHFFGVEVSTPGEAIHYGKQLVGLGAQNVIVSLAGEGAVFINKDIALSATVPKGEVISSVGAGDSMVAGFLAKTLQTGSLLEAFKYSVAAGSATAFSLGLGTREKAMQLLEQVQLREAE